MIRRFEAAVIDWLCRLDPQREPLYGDLCEELCRGRSHLWLWRQLSCAARTAAVSSAWTKKRALAEETAVGGAILILLIFSGYVTLELGTLVMAPMWTALLAHL